MFDKIMNFIDAIMNFLEEKVVAVMFSVIVVVVFVQVVCRAFGASLPWSEEVARYLIIWSVFIGSSRCVKNAKHLSVEVVTSFVHGKAKIVLDSCIDAVCFIFFVFLAYYGIRILNGLMAFRQHSPGLRINMVFCYAAPVVGIFMMAIRSIQRILKRIYNVRAGDASIQADSNAVKEDIL